MNYRKIKPLTSDEMLTKSVSSDQLIITASARVEAIFRGAPLFSPHSSLEIDFGDGHRGSGGASGKIRFGVGSEIRGNTNILMSSGLEMEIVLRPARKQS